MTEEDLAIFHHGQDREVAPRVWQFKQGSDVVAPKQVPRLQPKIR